MNYLITPGGPLRGTLSLPGDKSISHRALMLAAIAEGTSRLSGLLQSEDIQVTLAALKVMGVKIEEIETGEILVEGVGKHGLAAPTHALNMGNSGTAARLFSGLLAGQGITCRLTGDESLLRRPMQRLVKPLQLMNASISCSAAGTLPIRIEGGRKLQAIDYQIPVASAQLKSCLLLAGLYAEGKTCIQEPVATRDHTERMLGQFGCGLERKDKQILLCSSILQGTSIVVPADLSSAAFFLVAACISNDTELILKAVGINPRRDAIIHILRAMGADIVLLNQTECSGEPIADILVRSGQLRGIDIPPDWVPSAIDELPVILVAAACAIGQTTLVGASELRFKESDRIAAMTQGLKSLGIEVHAEQDSMTVVGGVLQGGEVDSFADHRIAMAFTIAGHCARNQVLVKNCAKVATSFPDFVRVATETGINIQLQEEQPSNA